MQPQRLDKDQLFINVDSHVWLQELHYYRDAILSKLKGFRVSSIKLRVGRVRSVADHNDQEPLPPSLSAEEYSSIKEMTGKIHDESLRESVERVIEKSLLRLTRHVSHR